MLSVPRLPTELCERVIDSLHASRERKAVASCSLVCSTWTQRSAFHIFADVHLNNANWRSFLELLASPASSSGIAAASRLFINIPDAEDLYALIMAPSFARLRSIEHLSLHNADLTALPLKMQSTLESALARCMKNTTSVELNAMTFHDLGSCLRLAMSFAKLAQLRLVNVLFLKYLEHNMASAAQLALPTSWVVLEVDGGEAIPAFVHCLAASTAAFNPCLRLRLENVEEGHVGLVQKSLAKLSVRFSG
ncbi:hypothetical protein HMN09_01322900 [Mycena chlorophos]|uniref:F-box domain-containing protein n=1 Tax=Mycena chlorophos TaxID=658473 RepID=A0A8H6VPS5_MYCCL|nr:hypothetical protein HMN09_01322900 [Mycena chlorophos]